MTVTLSTLSSLSLLFPRKSLFKTSLIGTDCVLRSQLLMNYAHAVRQPIAEPCDNSTGCTRLAALAQHPEKEKDSVSRRLDPWCQCVFLSFCWSCLSVVPHLPSWHPDTTGVTSTEEKAGKIRFDWLNCNGGINQWGRYRDTDTKDSFLWPPQSSAGRDNKQSSSGQSPFFPSECESSSFARFDSTLNSTQEWHNDVDNSCSEIILNQSLHSLADPSCRSLNDGPTSCKAVDQTDRFLSRLRKRAGIWWWNITWYPAYLHYQLE